jgi:serine/threonine protein kinase
MALNAPIKALRTFGSWETLEKAGASGISTWFSARNRVSAESAVVKVMPPFAVANDKAFQRFARECRILSALNDPHIVRALDFGIEGCEPYLVMELVEGDTLGQRLAAQGSLLEAEAVRLISQVAGALGRAHQRGLIHRNLNPDSILITVDGQAKLTDLSLMKEAETQQDLTRDGTFLGTPNFMAPEQFFNASKATRSGDVYALAATLYMAVTGRVPFGGYQLVEVLARKRKNDLPPPKLLVPTLSERTDQAIRRAMQAQPECRTATCGEFLEHLQDSGSVAAVPDTTAREEVPALSQAAPKSVVRQRTHTSATAMTVPTGQDESDDYGWLVMLLMILGTIAGFLAGLYLLSRVF